MKTQFLLALSCLLLFLVGGYAQSDPSINLSIINIPPPGMDFIQAQRSYMTQIPMKNNWKSGIRWYWSGQGADLMAFTVMHSPDLRAAWNLSDEQHQQLKDCEDNIDNARQNDPEYQQLMEEIQAMRNMINPDDPFPLNADEEIKNKWLEIEERAVAWMTNYYSETIRSILTPQQQQQLQETHLANMEDYPIVSPYLFEALGLTDDQKQEMEEIKSELESDFEMFLEDFVNDQLFLVNRVYDELEKLGVKDVDGMMKELSTVRKILADDPDFTKVLNESETKSKQFATQFKTRMFDVLNDEQWTRLQKLIADPPEHVRAFRNKFQKRKEGEDESNKSKEWQPGPGSWRPGDPIPEQYRQERNEGRRFPRTEN